MDVAPLVLRVHTGEVKLCERLAARRQRLKRKKSLRMESALELFLCTARTQDIDFTRLSGTIFNELGGCEQLYELDLDSSLISGACRRSACLSQMLALRH